MRPEATADEASANNAKTPFMLMLLQSTNERKMVDFHKQIVNELTASEGVSNLNERVTCDSREVR